MLRRSLLGMVSCLALVSCTFAQDNIEIRPNLKGGQVLPSADQQKSDEDSGKKQPIGPYAFAILATIIVLAVICSPSRKA